MNAVIRLGFIQSPAEMPETLSLYGWQPATPWAVETRDKDHGFHSGNMWFHQDSLRADCRYFAVWSNTGGTIVKIRSSVGYQIRVAKPFELLVIDNDQCEHKSPHVITQDRIFARLAGVQRKEIELCTNGVSVSPAGRNNL